MDAGRPADAHRRYEEMAVAHVMGGLDESEGRDFRSHLLECTDCRARVGELRALAHDLADVERDERRVRAARTVETKRRDGGEGGVEHEEPQRPVRPRLMTVLGVAAILALTAWNFTLRETVAQFNEDLDRSTDAAAALEFGAAATVTERADSVRAQAKTDRNSLVLLIEGLQDDQVYGLYILDGMRQPVFRAAVRPTDGRLFSLIDYPEGAEHLLVTLPGGTPGAEPEGEHIFAADLVPPRPPAEA